VTGRAGRFLRTTAFRLALIYVGLFCASVAALFTFVYAATDALMDEQREQAIVADMGSLQDLYLRSNLATLADAIRVRTQPEQVGDRLYLLAQPDFRRVAGNMLNWPRQVEIAGPWIRFPIQRVAMDDDGTHHAVALHVELPGGYHLLIGQDSYAQTRFQSAILRVFLWATVIALALGIGGGLFMSRNMLRRIEAINRGAEHVMRGNVGYRIPLSGSGDELDRLAANLNAMLDEIERLMASMRQVTTNIAHDLRSPLTRIRQRLEEGLAGRANPARRLELMEQATAEADQLLATFNAMLSIADAESGAGRAEMAPLELTGLAADVAELYAPLAEERGIVLETDLAAPAMAPGNRHLLFQAVANLVDNAVKYGATGGVVRLAVATRGPGGGPEIIVADKGPGIPAADRGRVLDRFVRLDASRTMPGNGLGLALVAAIVRLHGATLALEDNEPGLRVVIRFREGAKVKGKKG